MTHANGLRIQNVLAAYLRQTWPSAESTGAGRQGADITGIPGVAFECKTAADFKRDFRPRAWADQAIRNAGGNVPVVAYFPPGIGAALADKALAIVPLGVLVQLLDDAGYASGAHAGAGR